MSILAIDAGNSRIKWGLWADRGFIAQGAVLTQRAPELADALHMLARPERAIGSCVAQPQVRGAVEAVLALWHVPLVWIVSQRSQCGVVSRYDEPAQLGPDRWAALVGARSRYQDACVVVNAGTAVTVDSLTAAGHFAGGLILPGLDLMARALETGTARLTHGPGRFDPFPRNTADAIASGALQAVCGAIERTRQALEASGETAPRIVLSGGAAEAVAPYLRDTVSVVPALVLEGLIAIART